MFREWIWKVFPPYEVIVIRREIERFLEEDNGLCKDTAFNLVTSYIRHNPQAVVDAIRIEHAHPEHYALALLGGILKAQLGSGQYHSYRGRLGIIGDDMKRLWDKVINNLVNKGYIEKEYAHEIRSSLYGKIKSIG